jgi:FkbM family methyltransferase
MKVFIDCGANLGQGLLEFDKKFKFINNDEWEVHTFEPNPDIKLDFKKGKNIRVHKKAIWFENSTIDFARTPREFKYNAPDGLGISSVPGEFTNVGCRIKDDKIQNVDGGGKILDNMVTVPTIDFSEFLKQFKDYDQVIVKMDIEGAEYKVLRHLMKEGTTTIMDELYVETHERFVSDENANTTNQLLNEVRKHNVKVEKWV